MSGIAAVVLVLGVFTADWRPAITGAAPNCGPQCNTYMLAAAITLISASLIATMVKTHTI